MHTGYPIDTAQLKTGANPLRLSDVIRRHRLCRSWWRHQMETFSALLTICAGNSPVTSEFPTQRPVTRSFDIFFDLCLNEWLSKQSCGWWFETPSRPLWRHSNGNALLPKAYHQRCFCGIHLTFFDINWPISQIWTQNNSSDLSGISSDYVMEIL